MSAPANAPLKPSEVTDTGRYWLDRPCLERGLLVIVEEHGGVLYYRYDDTLQIRRLDSIPGDATLTLAAP